MTSTAATGQRGEDIAARYLSRKGYVVQGRNVRFGRYEIDIVSYDPAEKMMVFVEVKTRQKNSDTYPIRTAVDGHKRAAMKNAIAHWVTAHNYDGPGRTDIVCVSVDEVVAHFVNIGSDFF